MYINDTKHPFYHSNQIIYIVKHVEVFKAPSRFNGTLPQYIYTPFESAACGLDLLSKGHEYLLSGHFSSHNIATTSLCGQILSDLTPTSGIIQEWNEVDDLQKVALQHNGYEPCHKGKIQIDNTNKTSIIPTTSATTATTPVSTTQQIQQTPTEKVIKN
uniref:NTR domain-containing protein n=1 Tax=Strongyloides papillosus TaxID=174720 RepID=A0A0N5CDS0_STREA